MGRNAKPVSLHIAEGNPNRLTKAQIQQRQQSEIKLGKNDLSKVKPPEFIKRNTVAYSHWKQCMKEYKEAAEEGIEILASSDIDLLALYCMTYTEYLGLLDLDTSDFETEMKRQTAINKKMDMLMKMQDRLFLNPLAKVKNVPKPKEKERPESKFSKFGGGRGG